MIWIRLPYIVYELIEYTRMMSGCPFSGKDLRNIIYIKVILRDVLLI